MSSSEPYFSINSGSLGFDQSTPGTNSAALQTSLSDNRFGQILAASSDPASLLNVNPSSAKSGTGLLGQYYNNLFADLKLMRTDASIDFDWGSGSPDPTVPVDGFSVRWIGKVQPAYSETYTFYTLSDDGIRLWVNGQQIINNWNDHPAIEDSSTITLIAGQKYDLKLEYYEGVGGAISKLSWSSPSQKKEIIPQSQLYEPDLTLPTADLIAANITKSGAASYSFNVIYKDATAVKLTTIDSQDAVVSGPNNFSQPAKLVNVSRDRDSSLLTAAYSIDAPGGVWDSADSGIYAVTLQANQVSDSDGNFIPAGVLGTFRVDLSPPTAKFVAANSVASGGTNYRFSVTYSDDTAISRRTIDNPNVIVSGPNNFSQVAQFTDVSSDRDISLLTVIYGINAPGGTWDSTDTGTYTVTLQANQVSDVNGNFTPAGILGTFRVDLTPSTAALTTNSPVINGIPRYSFSVIYRDETGVSQSSIDNLDILINGPKNFSQLAKLVSVSSDQDRSFLTATYSIDAPNGIWNSTDNGTYIIALQANQISDLNGNFTPAGVLGTFQVDLSPPTARLTEPDWVIDGTTSYSFSVIYSDNIAVKQSTIDSQDILVKGFNNFSQLAKLVSVSSSSNGSPLTATYSIDAPGGVWNSAATGIYTFMLQANQVSDTTGNFASAASLGILQVDLTPPTAKATTTNIAAVGDTGYIFSVTYSDGTAVKRSTIDNQDVRVNGPNNFNQVAKIVSVTQTGDAPSLTATYRIDAPNGTWDRTTIGTYMMTLQANQVSDINNNFIPATALGTFEVDNTLYEADFNGDGKADLLLRDATSQKLEVWLMNGTTMTTRAFLPELGSTYRIAGIADFDGDGKADILVRDTTNQKLEVWLMNGTTLKTKAFLPDLGSNYTIAGLADFDRDGKADILLRNAATQKVGVWLMNGTTLKATAFLPNLSSNYTIAGLADFDGDSKADILLRDASNQKMGVWLINGTILKAAAFLPDLNSTYTIAGLADFDGDGKADILLRDAPNQNVAVWLINGTILKAAAFLPDLNSTYTISGLADFDGDGKADILLRDVPNQKMGVWLIDGSTFKTGAFLPDLASVVSIAGLADFDSNNKADILLRDAINQNVTVWLINGTQVANTKTFTTKLPVI